MTLSTKPSNDYRPIAFAPHVANIGELARELQQHDAPLVVLRDRVLAAEDTDSGVAGQEDLAARNEPVRRALAIRRIKGEVLSDAEQLVLSSLNHRLAELLPAPAPVPPRAEQALMEATRLLRKYAGG